MGVLDTSDGSSTLPALTSCRVRYGLRKLSVKQSCVAHGGSNPPYFTSPDRLMDKPLGFEPSNLRSNRSRGTSRNGGMVDTQSLELGGLVPCQFKSDFRYHVGGSETVITLPCDGKVASSILVCHPIFEGSSMVEQGPVKTKVVGSTPTLRAIFGDRLTVGRRTLTP